MEEPQLVDRVLGALLAPGTWTGSLPAAAPADAGTAPLLPGPCTPEMLDFKSLAPSQGAREGAEQDERAAAHLEEQHQTDLGDEAKHDITKLARVKLQAPGNLERAEGNVCSTSGRSATGSCNRRRPWSKSSSPYGP